MTRKEANKLRGLLVEYRRMYKLFIWRGKEDAQEQEYIEDDYHAAKRALYAHIRKCTREEATRAAH